MSLEEALVAATKALNENTKALNENTTRLDKMLGGATVKTTTGGKTTESGKTSTSGKSTGGGKKTVTKEDLAARATAFLTEGTAAAREEHKAQMAKMIAHYEVQKITAIDPSLYAEAIGFIDTFDEGGTPEPFAEDDEGGGEDDDSMV